MKIRKGFISNSSSTSFTIAVIHSPETEFDYATLLEFFLEGADITSYFTDLFEWEEDLNRSITVMGKTIKELERRIADLEAIPENVINALQLLQQSNHGDFEYIFSALKYKDEGDEEYEQDTPVASAIREIEYEKENATERLIYYKRTLEKLEKAKSEIDFSKFKLLEFKLDDWKVTKIENAMGVLEKAKQLVVLDKVRN